MSGTKKGGQKTAATNKARYGENFYRDIGRKGGRSSGTGGFFHAKYVLEDVEYIRQTGAKGGRLSRRKARLEQA